MATRDNTNASLTQQGQKGPCILLASEITASNEQTLKEIFFKPILSSDLISG
jgi:hypothetical protein